MYKKLLPEWQILRRGRRIDFVIIAAITVIFLAVIVMNVRLIFKMTMNQTEEIGRTQLEVIRSDFQGTILQAKGATLRLAMEAEQLLKVGTPRAELEKFIHARKREQKSITNGVCFNTYIAGKDWAIIPDFDMPPEYHASERIWFKGAQENPGQIYITEPYIDAMTENMCFTISQVLDDGSTVVAMDFTFGDVQQFIRKMSTSGDRKALIVTQTGMIIGYNDMSLVGKRVSDKLPEYEGILERVVRSNRHESFAAQIDGHEQTVFTTATTNGWYIILSVDNDTFYEDSYRQIFLTTVLSLIMLLAIIFFYLNALKNRLQAQTALHVKEEFLSRMSHELRDPVSKILSAAAVDVLKSDADPAEKAAEVRESALKLSGMLDNLFSFSTMVSQDKKKSSTKEKNFRDEELAKISRYARIGILGVLIVAMMIAFSVALSTTISWGDTKMNREVDAYEHQLSSWVEKQRAVLSMFANLVREHPELMNDYGAAVKFLDDIAKHYPEISVCYLANPYKEHQVIMNNGWESPDPNWKVDERPWYIETEHSVSGFSVSAPYYDAQTGLYCVTMAQLVFSDKNEFIGIFAIDFYINSLTQVLGASYTNDSYAFLVDRNGVIINHPNSDYQLYNERMTNIADTEYAAVYSDDGVDTLRDYNYNFVACLAKKNTTSQFTVVVANRWWNIYGNIILLWMLFLALPSICILIVNELIDRLLRWQESVNRQLKDASDTALAASRAKSQFLAQMSHEIRTPINAVLGMNEMILRESKSKEILDYAANIQSAGKTLLTLINSILDFSKIEDGKMEIVPVRYETGALLDDMVNMTSEKARKKGLEFRTEIDPALPKSLYGDDVRLRQIITNILTNAVKYTHEGSVTLRMSGTSLDADTLELRVAVIDTGIGIRREDMSKLFQSFQRLDEERNRNIEGTGLGIAIVQKLLTMMGSKLEVVSEYGAGSEFSFRLVQKIIDKSPIGAYDGQHLKSDDTRTAQKFLTAHGARVLAVDDNDMNLKVISGLLKRNQIVPDIAESGKQGIELVKKNFYHIIFMDNMMPELSGVETLKAMRRENLIGDKTSVVMLTASAIAGVRENYLGEGFDDYLSKPIDVGELESILERHLPADIVSFVSAEEPMPEPEPVNKFSELDLETALNYCMGSKDFLAQMFMTFIDEKRVAKIQAAFDSGDLQTYRILVHALKSTSMTVGALGLGESAKALEAAAKMNDKRTVEAQHAKLMAKYQTVCEQIKQWLEANA